MDLPRGFQKDQQFGEQYWREHIERAQNFPGTKKEYCRVHGLNYVMFCTYRVRLGFSEKRKVRSDSKGFVAVQVTQPFLQNQMDLPDPRWLAEFLRAWSQK